MNTFWSRTRLIVIGASLVIPMALLTTVLVAAENQVTAAAMDTSQQTPPPTGVYAQSFAMTIFEQDRTIRLWLVDLDTAPYLRQTVEAGGNTVSDQIYRFDERTLYTADSTGAESSTWTSIAPVEPQDLGFTDLATGPAAWAAEFGPGEQEIPIAQGATVRVVIDSVDEPIDPTVFQVPSGATVTPVQP